MKESLGKSLGTFLDERLSNPVVSSFVLAWCGWNYPFFLALFSKNTVTDTLRLIQSMYPDWEYRLTWGFAVPAATAAAYLTVVPLITTWYYRLTAALRKAQDEAMYEAEKHKRLSAADSAELQNTVRRTRAELDEETAKVGRLQGQLAAAANQEVERLQVISKLQDDLELAVSREEKLRASEASRIGAELKARSAPIASLVAIFRSAIGLSGPELEALRTIAVMDRGLKASATDSQLPLDHDHAISSLTSLEGKGLITKEASNNSFVYFVTDHGVDVVRYRMALDEAKPRTEVEPEVIDMTHLGPSSVDKMR